jgi:hypothetical protein
MSIYYQAFPLGLYLSIQSSILQVIREGAGALHPEIPLGASIHKESFKFPVVGVGPLNRPSTII